jgi:UV DNA damage endonuclease
MHPGQFVVINSPNTEVFRKSIKELIYHLDLLELLGLGERNKIQIHVGGVYGNKTESLLRFIKNFKKLPQDLQKILAIENDEKNYSIKDCYKIYENLGVPLIFDNLHHNYKSDELDFREALTMALSTWKDKEIPMIDFSSSKHKKGKHNESIDIGEFSDFIRKIKKFKKSDIGIMLEVKDKEKSALKALEILRKLT